MDITSIIIVILIVSAFLIFAGVLMYGDYATQQPRRARADKASKPLRPESIAQDRRAA